MRADVKLHIKLPEWITNKTSIGRYNPDWTIVMDGPGNEGDRLYLVRKTKSTLNSDALRADERRSIDCGHRHFEGAPGVRHKVVMKVAKLP